MECKECEKMIPAIMADEVDYRELEAFWEHVEGCAECREELTIQVLISEGMARLEQGSAFDLQKEIEGRAQAAAQRVRVCRILMLLRLAMWCFVSVAVVMFVILLII